MPRMRTPHKARFASALPPTLFNRQTLGQHHERCIARPRQIYSQSGRQCSGVKPSRCTTRVAPTPSGVRNRQLSPSPWRGESGRESMRNGRVYTGAGLDSEPLLYLATPLLVDTADEAHARVDARPLDYCLRGPTGWQRKNSSKGTTNMSTKLSFHKALPHSGGKPHLIDRGGQPSTSGRMSVRTTVVIIASLVGFAVLHVVGGTLMMRASDRILVEPAHMSRAD
jgi:hypothetical protein